MENKFLKKYQFKRKLDSNYFRSIDHHFDKVVCYYCLLPLGEGRRIDMTCSPECQKQLDLRSSDGLLRHEIITTQGLICSMCGVNGESLRVALRIYKRSNSDQQYQKRLQELKVPLSRVSRPCNLIDVDHIIPVSKGGGAGIEGDIRANCQPLCLYCHDLKDNKKPLKGRTLDNF